jgi:thiol-disulfide isomerase/thioredoxin
MRRARVFAAVIVLAAVVSCSRDDGVRDARLASPFDPCPAPVTATGAPAATTPPADPIAPAAPALGPVTLPCFTGGEPVAVAGLGRPSVVNLWASWCEPCRTELPELQRFADLGADQVTVLGVITGDTRTAAAAAAEDFGVSFPAVFDPDRSLLASIGRNALPVTLFLDAKGGIRHLYQGAEPLTLSTLERLTRQYLGVVVS